MAISSNQPNNPGDLQTPYYGLGGLNSPQDPFSAINVGGLNPDPNIQNLYNQANQTANGGGANNAGGLPMFEDTSPGAASPGLPGDVAAGGLGAGTLANAAGSGAGTGLDMTKLLQTIIGGGTSLLSGLLAPRRQSFGNAPQLLGSYESALSGQQNKVSNDEQALIQALGGANPPPAGPTFTGGATPMPIGIAGPQGAGPSGSPDVRRLSLPNNAQSGSPTNDAAQAQAMLKLLSGGQ